MKNLILKRVSALVLSLIFSFTTIVSAAEPIIEKTTEEKKEIVAQAGAALEQRINKIENAETFTETDKHVFDVVNSEENKSENTETSKAEDTETEEPKTESAEEKTEEPKAEDTEEKTEEPKVEDTEDKAEEPKAEDTEEKTEEPKVEDTEEKTEEPKVEDTEEKTEEPKVEDTEEKTEEPKVEDTEEKTEEPKVEDAEEKTENTENKTETPKEETENKENKGNTENTEKKPEKEEENKKYDWEDLSDEDFEKWVFNKANRKSIKEFVLAENDEYKAFEARINLIEDAKSYQKIKQHIYDIKATEFDEKEQDKFEFPWTGMSDEEFAAWVTSGEHDSYILRILTKGEDDTPNEALTARIKDMQDEELLNNIYEYLVSLGLTEFETKPEEIPEEEIKEEITEETEEKTEENLEEGVTEENPEEEKPEEEVPEEIPEEVEDEPKTTYCWDGLSDEEFVEWLLSEENLQYIIDVFSGKTSEELEEEYPEQIMSEKDSLWERIEKIADVDVLEKVKEYINGFKPQLMHIVLKNEEYNVTVEGDLPEGASLQVTPVSFETLNEYVEEGQKIICAYDITIFVNGEEYQPEDALSVTFGEIEKVEKISEIKHIHKDKKTGKKKIEKIKPEKGAKLSFKAKKFSIYMALATEFTENDKVTVHFNPNVPNDGTYDVVGDPMNSFEYVLGSDAVTIPCHFFTAGYGFINWNTAPDGSGTYYNDVFESVDETLIGKEITLYAQWSDVIYFDIDANCVDSPIQGGGTGIRVNKYDYRGYVWEYKLNEKEEIIDIKIREIAGKHYPENTYYTYMTVGQTDSTAERYGRFVFADGHVEYRLPEYTPVVVKDGDKETPWGEYIINHPMNAGKDFASNELGLPELVEKFHQSAHYTYKSTNGSNRINGAPHGNFIVGTKIERPIEDPENPGRDTTGNSWYKTEQIIESVYPFTDTTESDYGNVGNVNIIFDNIWVSWHRDGQGYVERTTGPLQIEFTNTNTKNNTVNLFLKGDNRLGNICYSTYGKEAGNKFIVQTHKDNRDATLTIADAARSDMNNNWMDAPLGSREGYSCDGLVIKSGTIYVGTTSGDMTTAIGAGAGPEGYANITIEGGTVTAVSNSGGAAIGGGAGYVVTNDSDYGPSFTEKIVNYGDAGGADITINGGKVYAYNGGNEEMHGVSIGGGSALENNGGFANINISENATVIAGSIGGGKTYKPETMQGGVTTINYSPSTVNAQLFVPENAPGSVINVPDGVTFDGADLINTDLIYTEPNGGAVNLGDGSINLTNATIQNYTVSGYGGGIYVKDGTVNLPDIKLLNNKAKYGGAIAVDANERTTDANITVGVNMEHTDDILSALNYSHSYCPYIYNNTATEEAGAIYFKANENTNFNVYCLTEQGNSAEGEFVYHESDFLKTTGSGGSFVLEPKGQITINGTSYVDGSNVVINGTVNNPVIKDFVTVDVENKDGCSFEDNRNIVESGYTKIKLIDNFEKARPSYVQGSSTRYKIKNIPVGETYTFKDDTFVIPGAKLLGWHKTHAKGPEVEFDYPIDSTYITHEPTTEDDYLTVYAIWDTVIYHIRFNPNWPVTDTSETEGEMPEQTFNYDQHYTLNKNTFTLPVWNFIGWNTKDDGSGTWFDDEQDIYNLTDKNGEIIDLYAQWSEYIYFDYNANASKGSYKDLEGPTYVGTEYNIKITADTYSGYIFSTYTDENDVDHTIIKEVTGKHRPGNKYYIYSSKSSNYNTTGEVNHEMIIPKYSRVTTDSGTSWGDFITNNTDVVNVFDTWYSRYSKNVGLVQAGSGNMRVIGNVGEVTIVIDSLYSGSHWTTANTANTGTARRGTAPIHIDFDNSADIQNNKVHLLLKGDNRFGAIHYSTYTTEANENKVQDYGNRLIIDAFDSEENPTLTLGDLRTGDDTKDVAMRRNFYSSALGSDTSYNQCTGIEIKGGIIFAGTSVNDFATAIGAGGNGSSKITINGGTVTAVSHSQGAAIGGGIGGSNTKGGSTEVTIEGGKVYAYNFGNINATHVGQLTDKQNYITGVAIGSGSGIGGDAGATSNVTITGGEVYAQSVGGTAIGGGSSIDGNATPAEVNISGGTVIAKSLPGVINETEVPVGLGIGGGKGGTAGNGGSATINISGDAVVKTGSIGGNITTNSNGHAGDSTINITSGTVTGQIALMDGTENESVFNLKGGTITGSDTSSDEFVTLYKDGGAVYINNPLAKVNITGGSITNCKADSGGAIAALGGTVIMSAGELSENTAENAGGAIYVSSADNDAAVDMLSGTISNNTAQKGGAVAIVDEEDNINNTDVVIGVNELHDTMPFNHTYKATLYNHSLCPVLKNNSAEDGGAIYLDGSDTNTKLSIYCLDQSDEQDGEHSFIRMDGGDCLISAENDKGKISIGGSSYISGGTMNLKGSMANPTAKDYFTVEPSGTFNDNRPDKDQYGTKIRYVENFKGSEKYKAIDIPTDETVTIPSDLYTHTGYHIVNWNTTDDNSADVYENDSTYNPDSYTDSGYLTLYAIWDINKYHIAFDPNVPLNESYQGEMEEITDIPFDQEQVLPANKFERLGYVFMNWNTKADGSGTQIADEATVRSLSTVMGDTVTLYAQWKGHDEETGGSGGSGEPTDPENPDPENPDPENPDPENPDPEEPEPEEPLHIYTYTAQGSTLIRTCTCGIQDRAVLSASDTVYNGEVQNTVTVEYTSNVDYSVWEPAVSFSDDNPVDAGTYTASVTEGGETATVSYKINKAEQDAPPTPTFTEERTETSTTLTVDEIPDNGKGDRLYRVVYYDSSELETTPWSTNTVITVDKVLTNYYVEAKYDEAQNYNESPETPSATGSYAGNVRIEVFADEGVTYEVETQANKVIVNYSIDEGYYKTPSFEGTVDAETGNPQITYDDSQVTVTNLPDDGVVLITISGVKKLASATVMVAEGEEFATVVHDDSPIISRDSAFTAYFEIDGYISGDYSAVNYEFSREIPEKTTIILVDKTLTDKKYWYYETTSAEKIIDLTQFKEMGGDGNFSGIEEGKYQFIVDFSKTSTGCTGTDITMSLSATAQNGQESDFETVVTVGLRDASFEIVQQSSAELSATLNLAYNNSAKASKWENRRTALVLTPEDGIPVDAKLKVTKGTGNDETITVRSMTADGSFIVPIGYLMSDVVTVELVSEMLPGEETEYDFECNWVVSNSSSGVSSLNGEIVATMDLKLTKSETTIPSVKLTSAQGGKKLFAPEETITVNANYKNVGAEDTVKATLLYKNASGIYENSGITQNLTNPGEISFELGSATGSFCILLEIINDRDYTVAKTPYYFVICD